LELSSYDEHWQPEHILGEDLLEEWNTISDDQTIIVEVSISYDLTKMPVFKPKAATDQKMILKKD